MKTANLHNFENEPGGILIDGEPFSAKQAEKEMNKTKGEKTGWLILSEPGTDHGPCAEDCKHTDCAETRRMALSNCKVCGEPIGYDRQFYAYENWQEFKHADCAWEEQEKKEQRK